MSIEELFSNRGIINIIDKLDEVEEGLKHLTIDIRNIINPDKKKTRDELFVEAKKLRLEAEDLIKQAELSEKRNDLVAIKNITKRVKEIVEEKRKIEKELTIIL